MLGEVEAGFDGDHLSDGPVQHQLLRLLERGMDRGNGSRHQGDATVGARLDHPVRLLQGEDHGLLRDHRLGPVLHRGAGQIRTALDVGADRHDVQPLVAQHLDGVGVEGIDSIALPEDRQPFPIPFRLRSPPAPLWDGSEALPSRRWAVPRSPGDRGGRTSDERRSRRAWGDLPPCRMRDPNGFPAGAAHLGRPDRRGRRSSPGR